MLYDEFVNHIDSGNLAPCYSITGEDAFWAKKAYKKLVGLVDSVDLVVLTSPTKIDEGMFALDMFPMFSPYKIVVFEDYDKFSNEDKTKIIKYLDNPSNGAALILYNSETIAHTNCKKYNFTHLTEIAVTAVIKERCAEYASSISSDAARLLAVCAELDMAIIDIELQKLVAYAGENGCISADMVRECVTPNITYQIYHFADAVARGSYMDAYGSLNTLTHSTGEYSRFLSNITSYYRMVFYAKISAMSDSELAASLSAKEYPVKKARAIAKKYGAKDLFDLLKLLYNLEFEFKSGKISVESALELAVAEAIERRRSE
ncbi:MAG: hypothetical protein EOM87_04010 [Clostridia bacterium]|nr:hypothetical protein [Clostridia bacterium]